MIHEDGKFRLSGLRIVLLVLLLTIQVAGLAHASDHALEPGERVCDVCTGANLLAGAVPVGDIATIIDTGLRPWLETDRVFVPAGILPGIAQPRAPPHSSCRI